MASTSCPVCAKKYSDHLAYCPHCEVYVLGGITFHTKTAVEEHAKKLKEIVGTTYVKGTPEFEFLVDLIVQGHPTPEEKLAKEVLAFVVKEDRKNITRFHLNYVDGTDDHFGYLKCKKYLSTPKDIVIATERWTKLLASCRVAVHDQTSAFFTSRPHTCALCGVSAPEIEYATDHFDPEFVDLVRAFDVGRTDTPTLFADLSDECINERLGATCFRPEDQPYEKAFWEYHREKAHLRILCVPCNLKRTRYPGIKKGIRREHKNP